MKQNETRLVIEIDKILHRSLKRRAFDKEMTLKNWILLAVAKLMQEEDEANKETNKI